MAVKFIYIQLTISGWNVKTLNLMNQPIEIQ